MPLPSHSGYGVLHAIDILQTFIAAVSLHLVSIAALQQYEHLLAPFLCTRRLMQGTGRIDPA
jgi:hypothetical protein